MGIRKFVHDLIHANEPKNVNEAFRITKFGQVISDETIFKRVLADIYSLMDSKMRSRSYSLVYDLDDNFPDIADKLYLHFENRGFNVVILNNDNVPGINGSCLFISWKQETC